jgi:serine protease Do
MARVHDLPFIVTNLHVLGDNKTLTVKTLQGKVLAWKGVAGAVGADIAILRVVDPEAGPAPLPLAEDVLATTKIGDQVIVVGNRLGGGVATQVTGKVLGVGGDRIEIDAPFQSGNSGSPVFDATTGQVLGIAAYTETVKIDLSELKTNAKAAPTVEKRWFAFRLDTVAKWETIDLARWHEEMKRVTDFHENSLALLAFCEGKLDDASSQPRLRSMIQQFKVDMADPLILASRASVNDVLSAEVSDMVRRAQVFANDGLKDFSAASYYDYFRTAPYSPENVNDQVEFRNDLLTAIQEILADIKDDQYRFGGGTDAGVLSPPKNASRGGRATSPPASGTAPSPFQ